MDILLKHDWMLDTVVWSREKVARRAGVLRHRTSSRLIRGVKRRCYERI